MLAGYQLFAIPLELQLATNSLFQADFGLGANTCMYVSILHTAYLIQYMIYTHITKSKFLDVAVVS